MSDLAEDPLLNSSAWTHGSTLPGELAPLTLPALVSYIAFAIRSNAKITDFWNMQPLKKELPYKDNRAQRKRRSTMSAAEAERERCAVGVYPDGGRSIWLMGALLTTFKAVSEETGGAHALYETTAPPQLGAPPPPPPP